MNFFKKLFSKKESFNNIIAAKVVGIEKHPNADRLRIVKLDVGNRIIEPIICGATNFGIGDIVILALPGAKIPQDVHSTTHEPFVLEKAKIRGIESQGMLCAAFELGLDKEPGQGIALLKNNIKPGSQFSPKMLQ